MSIYLSPSVFYWAGSQTAFEIWKSLEIQNPAIQLPQDQPQFQTTRINMGPSLDVQLYILRNIQLLFTVIYVVLMVYAAINPGKWLDLKEPLGLTPRSSLYFPDAVLMSGGPTYKALVVSFILSRFFFLTPFSSGLIISSVLVSCSILTIIATVPSILGCYRFPAEEIRKIYNIECFQTLYDSILFVLWIITFVFMRSEHGDSDLPGLGDPPKLSWHFGAILVAFET